MFPAPGVKAGPRQAVNRGARHGDLPQASRTRGAERERPEIEEPDAESASQVRQAAKAAWAKLIRKIYEVDPLLCHGTSGIGGNNTKVGAPLYVDSYLGGAYKGLPD